MYECVRLFVCAELVQYASLAGDSVVWMNVGGWVELQSMDLEIPQDHTVMLLN